MLGAQLARAGRADMGRQSDTFNNLLLGANQLRMGAAQTAMGYRPLQTGSTTTQQQSGLGTWLPQVAAAGMSAFTGGMKFSNPFSSMGGGSSSGGGGAYGNPNA